MATICELWATRWGQVLVELGAELGRALKLRLCQVENQSALSLDHAG